MPHIEESRGISSFIAIILLMVLAVSAGAVIYSYTMGHLGGLREGGQTFGRMSLDSAVFTDEGFTAYIRNVGEGAVVLDRAYVDSTPVEGAGYGFEVNGPGVGDDEIAEGETGVVTIKVPGGFEAGGKYEFTLVDKGNVQLTFTVKASVAVAGTGEDWLGGWGKRVKMTIDHDDIDSALSDFPVLIYLSSSSGRYSDDVSFIFDELGGDADRMKIAVTEGDGLTQCYVEIEGWDDANERAWLWVRVPSISSSADTELYLYYNSGHADNTDYVGDTDSTPADAVWDDNFKAVWHLGESTGGTGAVKDSTYNSNDGTDSGGPTLGVAGKMGNAIHFDGGNDYVLVPDDVSLRLGGGLTIEAWINIDIWGNWDDIVFKGGGSPSNSDYQFALVSNGLAWDGTKSGSWRTKYFPTSQDTGTWIHAVVTHDTVTVKCYRDGSEINSQSDAGAIYESTYQLGISREGAAASGYLDGRIDEIRISNTPRSSAWIRTSYESENDDLLDFSSEETT
jgi:hypothetical protein